LAAGTFSLAMKTWVAYEIGRCVACHGFGESEGVARGRLPLIEDSDSDFAFFFFHGEGVVFLRLLATLCMRVYKIGKDCRMLSSSKFLVVNNAGALKLSTNVKLQHKKYACVVPDVMYCHVDDVF
jgi:hypothetical protein